MQQHQLVIIGAGPAGMAAACAAHENGIEDIIMIDREEAPGGILRQCIHSGFGIHRFGKELTGPEYAAAFEEKINQYGIQIYRSSMVTSLTNDRVITFQNSNGVFIVKSDAVILAMGCRERSRGALSIPGSRPAGVYTAGIAQKLVNCEGFSIGKKVVILGSGDIGLIMARRLTLEGAKVEAVCEILPYSNGLARNIVQCLDDFGIPLLLSSTVTEIHGKKRLSGVTVSKVDKNRCPIPGSDKYFDCDTLLLSVGLIPENELSVQAEIPLDPATKGPIVDQFRQTLVPGIFACGNVLQVHDLVDYVSDESELAGKSAAQFIKQQKVSSRDIKAKAGYGVSYVLPQRLHTDLQEDVALYFRVSKPFKNIKLIVSSNEKTIFSSFRAGVSPGEMEKLTIKPSALKKLTENLTISVEES